MRQPRLAFRSVILAICLAAACAPRPTSDRHSYLGARPPEIISEQAHWIETAEPLTFKKLKGKVGWLHFNF